jgi:hypothetical protein
MGWHALLPMTSISPSGQSRLGNTGSHQPCWVMAHPVRQVVGGPTRLQVQSGGPLSPPSQASTPTGLQPPPGTGTSSPEHDASVGTQALPAGFSVGPQAPAAPASASATGPASTAVPGGLWQPQSASTHSAPYTRAIDPPLATSTMLLWCDLRSAGQGPQGISMRGAERWTVVALLALSGSCLYEQSPDPRRARSALNQSAGDGGRLRRHHPRGLLQRAEALLL